LWALVNLLFLPLIALLIGLYRQIFYLRNLVEKTLIGEKTLIWEKTLFGKNLILKNIFLYRLQGQMG